LGSPNPGSAGRGNAGVRSDAIHIELKKEPAVAEIIEEEKIGYM
jgi:hypothetical protein